MTILQASASTQLLSAVWRRCYEEALPLASNFTPSEAQGESKPYEPNPLPATNGILTPGQDDTSARLAAAAALLAAQLDSSSIVSSREEGPGEEPSPVLSPTPEFRKEADYGNGTSVSPIALEDLSSIQEMIRRELQDEDDLDDEEEE